MRHIENDFLDMFLNACMPGVHVVTVWFGDERCVRETMITNRTGTWPRTVFDEKFLTVWRMLGAWLVGREAFLVVRSTAAGQHTTYPVVEVRCWLLTPVGVIPHTAVEASTALGMGGALTVWNMDLGREERYVAAWDRDVLVALPV